MEYIECYYCKNFDINCKCDYRTKEDIKINSSMVINIIPRCPICGNEKHHCKCK